MYGIENIDSIDSNHQLKPAYSIAHKTSILKQNHNNTSKMDEKKYNGDTLPRTCELQLEVEQNCINQREYWRQNQPNGQLLEKQHSAFLFRAFLGLGSSYQSLEASQTWIVYWIIHSLDLLGLLPTQHASKIVRSLIRCQHPNGGFGGGPGQLAHLASTYAAVHALMIIGGEYPKAYEAIDRVGLHKFLLRMHQPDGSFAMHEDGEVDIRGAYCALASAALTNCLTPELMEGTGKWIARCQTHEGGLGGNPLNEAHGGYTYCGLAAAILTDSYGLLDLEALLRWTTARQMCVEGGFQGRSNKLVDACYSWWVGGVFPLLSALMTGSIDNWSCINHDPTITSNILHFDVNKLREYLLDCCQSPTGGLLDKPGKRPDLYHTCYSLSGLAFTQSASVGKFDGNYDQKSNVLPLRGPINAVFNICSDRVESAREFFTACEQ